MRRPKCVLPALPGPVEIHAIDAGDVVGVTKDDWARIGSIVLDLSNWIKAAQICLEANQ